VVLSNGTLLSNKSGSIKERAKTSSEMGIGCQQNGHKQQPIICQVMACATPIKELLSAAGRCARRAVHKLGN